jgi:hypothetical protein
VGREREVLTSLSRKKKEDNTTKREREREDRLTGIDKSEKTQQHKGRTKRQEKQQHDTGSVWTRISKSAMMGWTLA